MIQPNATDGLAAQFGSYCRARALLCAAAWPVVVAAVSLACPTSAFPDTTGTRLQDPSPEPATFAYADLVLETRNISLRFPDAQGAEGRRSIDFVLVGNIPVKVQVEPDSRIQIGGRNLGRATRGSEVVGYDVAVSLGRKRSLDYSAMTGPTSAANFSSTTANSTDETEPSTAGHGRTGWFWYKRHGELTVKTNTSWSANGGLPLAGNYVGQVTITLTPDF